MGSDKNTNKAKLETFRRQIDRLDEQIVELLSKRAEVVVKIGKAKHLDGGPIYVPEREHAVLNRITELNRGPLHDDSLRAIYRELMSGSFALEKQLRVGYLGPEGSFSHLAAQNKFGSSVQYRPLADIRAVFDEVARGHCDLGLVPVERNIGGGVIDTLDSFIEHNVHICAEIITPIHLNLMARCAFEKINAVASKPEVFAQCRDWLTTSFKHIDLMPVASSAKAAEMAASAEALAAIGSSLAAELYGLNIVFANIEDNPNNMTRFLVISKTPTSRSGQDKTALMFTTTHKAGALVEVLNVFADNGINLTNIDTRPSKRRNWEYYFFVDAEGHFEDTNFIKALDEAKAHCGELHVLGSFPRAEPPG